MKARCGMGVGGGFFLVKATDRMYPLNTPLEGRRTYIHTGISTYTHAYMHTYIQADTYTSTHTYIQTDMQTNIQAYIHT